MSGQVADDGWETRMAARALARREQREAEQAAEEAAAAAKARDELAPVLDAIDPAIYHGWRVVDDGRTVLVGDGSHCAGCGRLIGIFTVALTDDVVDWAEGRPNPDWPYPEQDCPVCGAWLTRDGYRRW